MSLCIVHGIPTKRVFLALCRASWGKPEQERADVACMQAGRHACGCMDRCTHRHRGLLSRVAYSLYIYSLYIQVLYLHTRPGLYYGVVYICILIRFVLSQVTSVSKVDHTAKTNSCHNDHAYTRLATGLVYRAE